MNEPQKETIKELQRILPQAHFINIKVRINGEWREYEADFLKEIIGGQIEPPVKPDFTEITLTDYEKLGDTFIDAKTDPPLTQWRIIAGMLSSIGFKIIKK